MAEHPVGIVADGFGSEWVKCSHPLCDLEVVRPGKVQCSDWCEYQNEPITPHVHDLIACIVREREWNVQCGKQDQAEIDRLLYQDVHHWITGGYENPHIPCGVGLSAIAHRDPSLATCTECREAAHRSTEGT